jgi:hypothetical protein
MNLLYNGGYRKRFQAIYPLLRQKRVTELCFGDTFIARYCRSHGIAWTGYDINEEFVKKALAEKHNAHLKDLTGTTDLEPADICIISGSLYHFHNELESFILKMFSCAPALIISEPVTNLSSRKGIIGKLARSSSAVNGKEQEFRYTEESLLSALGELGKKHNFSFRVYTHFSKDIIIELNK